MTIVDSPREYFQSATSLVGESWLNDQLQEEQTKGPDQKVDYEVPLGHDDPPPVVVAYRKAKEDLEDNQTEVIELPKWRNDSIEFLKLGKIYQVIGQAPIVDPSGNQLSDSTVEELFRERLRSESEYESSKYELEVAASYHKLGHTPAFVKEDESQTKTPDIELLDLSPVVQIECKHCQKKSDSEAKQANRANLLFENIRTRLPQNSHAVLLELAKTPTKLEVENIQDYLVDTSEIKSSSIIEVSVPFGEMTIISLPIEEPILYPSYNMQGIDLMTGIYEDIIDPEIDRHFDFNKEFTDYGNNVLLFEANNRVATLLIRRVNFIAIKESTWGKDIYNRFQNQFKNVSGKFGEYPSVLHINFPDMNEGDAKQEQKLREHAGRMLIPRQDVSAVVVSGTIYHPTFFDELVTRRTIKIPNYDANHVLPEGYKLIDPETAQSVDELRKSAKADIGENPQAIQKAVAQEEGTISFRFKPNESRPDNEESYIADIVSEDEGKRLKLVVTPDEKIRLERLSLETGYWMCDIDVSDIPELSPIHVYMVWSPEQVRLSIGHRSDNELRHDQCESPIEDVIKEDGVPKRQ